MASTSDKVSQAGDVNIDDVTIITSNGFAQTITPQVAGIEIYEDVFGTFITGKIFVRDAQDLINLFPLVGEEVVRLKVSTPSLPDENSYIGEYYVYKMDDKTRLGEREMVYVLHFISKEAINDLNKHLSKAYFGKVSDIAKKLLTEDTALETKKPVNIEETSNETKFIANFWSPVKCLQYCADTAVNANESPSYVFFENKYGFNFISLETLYSGTPLKQRFVWDNYTAEVSPTGSSSSSIETDYQRVLEFQMPEQFNYIERLKSGMYGSEVLYFNILTKQYVHKGYVPEFEKDKHLNQYPPYTDKIAARPRAVMIHENTYYNNFDGFDDVTNSKTIQKRKSLMALAEAVKITINVFGRTDYSAGQKIYLSVPKNGQVAKTDPDYEDKIMSGNYLISAICHFITREKHDCTMELIKDSYMVNLNDSK